MANKLIRKFVKAIWKSQRAENEIYLTNYITAADFAKPTKILDTKKNLIEYFASVFTGNDTREAKRMLDKVHPKARRKDLYLSFLFLGMISSLVAVALVVFFIPGKAPLDINWIYNVIPVFRYLFIIDLCLFGTALVIKIFRRYAVNYISIFELDTDYRIREAQITRVALLILLIWLLCAFMQLVTYKFNTLGTQSSIFAFSLFIVLNIVLISPFKALYSGARGELISVIWNIFASPLSPVRFKDFFLADIFTSLVKPFQDMTTGFCFFTSPAWVYNGEPKCSWLQTALIITSLLPFLWRFLQCLHKYYDTRDAFPHLVNAGKYMSTIVTVVINLFNSWYNLGLQPVYIAGNAVATTYSYIWDLTMDWGLLRSYDSKSFLLRHKILYPAKFYYFAMVTNLILRLAWILTVLPKTALNLGKGSSHLLFFILSLAEAYRRTQWALFRVENENVNNFEKYRTYLEIPQLADDEQS
eukprot:TRINITY_DN2604_c0_g3_i1.p1 TRINITY_DN2604_c0_g3~~TRINITY_DN2604_c0_g3_i1.p1  ORF type:complete len:472 (-),score=79.64 TRINITY_DN2604_c0_g3_i1:139-1554(-)